MKIKSKKRLIKDIRRFQEYLELYIPPQNKESAEIYLRVIDGLHRFLSVELPDSRGGTR